MLATPQYYSGQGTIKVAKRLSTGRPMQLLVIGDCSAAQFTPKVQTETIRESMSGQSLLARIWNKTTDASLKVTCKQFTKTSVALGFYSNPITLSPGTVTGEVLPPGLVSGDEVALKHGNVSALVITDSAGTPATLTKDTNYAENNLVYGNVGILTPTGVQPYKAAYSYAAADVVPMFTQTPEERYIRIEGLNRAEDDAPVLIEYWKGRAEPFSSVDWIGDSASNQDINFDLLYDPLNGLDPNCGFFGRVTYL